MYGLNVTRNVAGVFDCRKFKITCRFAPQQVHLGVRCHDLIEAGAKAAGKEGGDGGFKPRCHYAVVADWNKPIDAAGNVIVVSIPSVLDPSLAPPGCHTVHAYTYAN